MVVPWLEGATHKRAPPLEQSGKPANRRRRMPSAARVEKDGDPVDVAAIVDAVGAAGVDLPGLARQRPLRLAADGERHAGLRDQGELVAALDDAIDAVEMRLEAAARRHQADPAMDEPSCI